MLLSTVQTPLPTRKPRDDEIDVYGITHPGKVRETNQDHFLVASIHRRVEVLQTSLLEWHNMPLGDERLAFLAMVADGVGGGKAGEQASATALEVATRYVASSMNCYYGADASGTEFTDALQEAAMRCHEEVCERAKADDDPRRMATTLTLFMGVWPAYYILQVGDSRYYLYRKGTLTQLTHDQTFAQEMIDQGILTPAIARRSRLNNVLSSAIGGEHAEPRVTRLQAEWGNVHLICSDGLTKHVSDERIAERLGAMTSAKSVCEELLKDALDAGGTDNITIIVGGSWPRDSND